MSQRLIVGDPTPQQRTSSAPIVLPSQEDTAMIRRIRAIFVAYWMTIA
jgi:hypothetical protein